MFRLPLIHLLYDFLTLIKFCCRQQQFGSRCEYLIFDTKSEISMSKLPYLDMSHAFYS